MSTHDNAYKNVFSHPRAVQDERPPHFVADHVRDATQWMPDLVSGLVIRDVLDRACIPLVDGAMRVGRDTWGDAPGWYETAPLC